MHPMSVILKLFIIFGSGTDLILLVFLLLFYLLFLLGQPSSKKA